jgi:alpha-L-fucosidase
VTSHGDRAWSWYQAAQGSDPSGPLAGVPYDGLMTKEDGKGLWWEGYDPQDLYAQ